MPALTLYAHPFSSYCQKALIALYENDTPLEYRALTPEQPEAFAETEALLAQPSFARRVDQARPCRKLFPLGAPDRD